MGNKGSIPFHSTKINNMTIINKYTGRDVSREFLALMEGTITNEEFELITMTLK
jgi:hypothetical protein